MPLTYRPCQIESWMQWVSSHDQRWSLCSVFDFQHYNVLPRQLEVNEHHTISFTVSRNSWSSVKNAHHLQWPVWCYQRTLCTGVHTTIYSVQSKRSALSPPSPIDLLRLPDLQYGVIPWKWCNTMKNLMLWRRSITMDLIPVSSDCL